MVRFSVGERIEESKMRDIMIEGAIIELKGDLALGRIPENYKDDTNQQSKQ